MQNDDEVLNGQSQEGGLPDGSFAERTPPMLLQGISTCKLIPSTDKMKAHLRVDLDKLELEHLIITMAISNGEDWAKRTRLDKMKSTDDTVENTEKNRTK